MTEPSRPRPVVLCILDGWGHRDDRENNAISLARTPVLDGLTASSPHALLDAAELAVGLPGGQMGNSEVGHMNLGAGRVVLQDLPRIDQAIAEGQLTGNRALSDFVEQTKASGGTSLRSSRPPETRWLSFSRTRSTGSRYRTTRRAPRASAVTGICCPPPSVRATESSSRTCAKYIRSTTPTPTTSRSV